jgi:hypothetical protein
VCARAFAAIIASRCAFFVHSLPLLQEIMMQSLVFELSSHGEVRVCPPRFSRNTASYSAAFITNYSLPIDLALASDALTE